MGLLKAIVGGTVGLVVGTRLGIVGKIISCVNVGMKMTFEKVQYLQKISILCVRTRHIIALI